MTRAWQLDSSSAAGGQVAVACTSTSVAAGEGERSRRATEALHGADARSGWDAATIARVSVKLVDNTSKTGVIVTHYVTGEGRTHKISVHHFWIRPVSGNERRRSAFIPEKNRGIDAYTLIFIS